MNELWWGEKKAGESILVGGPEKNELLIGVNIPDAFRLPTELGGIIVKVLSCHIRPCVKNNSHRATHFELEGKIKVAECPTCQKFHWYRLQNEHKIIK